MPALYNSTAQAGGLDKIIIGSFKPASVWARRPVARTMPSLKFPAKRSPSRNSPPSLRNCFASAASSEKRERQMAAEGSERGAVDWVAEKKAYIYATIAERF